NSYNAQNHPSVASQQSTLPMNGLPLLSPTTMLPSDYQSSSPYPLNMHEPPTVMSHPIASNNNSNNNSTESSSSSRYGPIRTEHRKSRTISIGSQRDFVTRTRTNSTASSASSNGALSSVTSALNSTTIGNGSAINGTTAATTTSVALSITHEQDEDEDSDSPTTIQMRPRANTTPRKAVAARIFECSVPGCSKAYTQLHNLKSHERTGHTPVIKLKPFHCIIEGCSKAFSQRKSLALHIKTAHSDFKFKPFKCSQGGCSKSYTQLHNLRTHEKTVHMVDLSRKRIKNPTMGELSGLGFGGCSPPLNTMDGKSHYHHHQQQQHQQQQHGQINSYSQHMEGPHSGLGLSYDGLNDLGLSHGAGHADSAYHYQRQHDHHQ
ncbi:hypothetical protein BGZ76_006686, partial [Entomortierella beljakovae]